MKPQSKPKIARGPSRNQNETTPIGRSESATRPASQLLTARETILQEAERVVDGPRRLDYGRPEVNHARTAAMWSAFLGIPITPQQVCILNILQKCSRAAQRITRDTLVDVAGFARNVEIIENPKGT